MTTIQLYAYLNVTSELVAFFFSFSRIKNNSDYNVILFSTAGYSTLNMLQFSSCNSQPSMAPFNPEFATLGKAHEMLNDLVCDFTF